VTPAGEPDDLPIIRRCLANQAEDLFRRLYDKPTKVRGHERRWGRKGSLVLYLRGRDGPHWYDYETCQGGDMISAIQHALSLDFVGALDWARDFLGLPSRKNWGGEHRRQAEQPRSRPHDAEPARKAKSAGDLAAAARPIGGTLADIYLRQHRSIEAAIWPDAALGFADAATVRRGTDWLWWRWPALVVRATDVAGTVTGVQLIALKEDGSAVPHWAHNGKLKLSYGRLRDAAVRLPGDDRALLLAEGPETALSCWWATGIATWSNLGAIARAPLDGVPLDRLIVV
jgi:putative DNA primase/helicase